MHKPHLLQGLQGRPPPPFPEDIVLSSGDVKSAYTLPEGYDLGAFSPVRAQSFKAGRYHAHQALAGLGVSSINPILQGKRGMPCWPEGVVGSITHTALGVVAAVAWKQAYGGLGVDFEEIARFKPALGRRILCKSEEEWIQQGGESFVQEGLGVIFSAKESLFKALYPLVSVYIGFRQATIIPDNRGGFRWQVVLAGLKAKGWAEEGEGSYWVQGGWIFSAVWLLAGKKG